MNYNTIEIKNKSTPERNPNGTEVKTKSIKAIHVLDRAMHIDHKFATKPFFFFHFINAWRLLSFISLVFTMCMQ